MNEKTNLIEDVHAEWHPEQGVVKLIAENLDGTEFLLDEVMPLFEPSFADESIPSDGNDYEDWYNLALEAAHKMGYIIAGECQAVELSKDMILDKLDEIWECLDTIQESTIAQGDSDLMWDIGEAMGSIANAIDDIEKNNKEEDSDEDA